MATFFKAGAASLSISSCFTTVSGFKSAVPVTLPPGYGKLKTKPARTGSPTPAMMTGTLDVTSRAFPEQLAALSGVCLGEYDQHTLHPADSCPEDRHHM